MGFSVAVRSRSTGLLPINFEVSQSPCTKRLSVARAQQTAEHPSINFQSSPTRPPSTSAESCQAHDRITPSGVCGDAKGRVSTRDVLAWRYLG